MTDLTAYLDRLTDANSVDALWKMHTQHMAGYGFDRLIYGLTRYRTTRGFGDPQDWILLSSQKPEYMETFFGKGLYFHAPMVQWALDNTGACSWGLLAEKMQSKTLTPDEQRVVEFNQSMQVTAGYTVSFASPSRRSKGAIALTAGCGLTQDQVDEIWAEHGDALLVMNKVMHLKLLTLPYKGNRSLTSRQREVLQWVGDGKTTQDIAFLLDLKPATVEKHLRLARETLGAETTAQAVLKAAFNNQMFVSGIDA